DVQAVGVVQLERIFAGDAVAVLPRAPRRVLEVLDAAVERADEALLLVLNVSRDLAGVALQFGERLAHRLDDRWHQFDEKRLLRPEHLSAISLRATEDALEDVAAALVADRRAVGERERETADVVRDDAVCGILQVSELAGVRRRAGDLVYALEDRC